MSQAPISLLLRVWFLDARRPSFRFKSDYECTRDSETPEGAILLAETMVPGGRVELPTPAFSGPRSTGELPRQFGRQKIVRGLEAWRKGRCGGCGASGTIHSLSF
jgi:hypothetical protein